MSYPNDNDYQNSPYYSNPNDDEQSIDYSMDQNNQLRPYEIRSYPLLHESYQQEYLNSSQPPAVQVPDINVSEYQGSVPNLSSPEKPLQRRRKSPPRQQHSPIRPLTNTYRRSSSSAPLQDGDPFHSSNTLYTPTESGLYGYLNTEMYTPRENVQDQEYYATSVEDQDFYSPLLGVNRSSSTLRYPRKTPLAYPETEYAPSINEIEEDPYNNMYLMNDISDAANLSNSNIPFIQQPQQQQQQQQQYPAQQGYYTNLFEPYAIDDQEDNIDTDFTPFPVTGDAYEINAYGPQEDDEPSFESSDVSEKSQRYDASSSILDEYYEQPKFGDDTEVPPEGDVPRRSKSTKGIKVKMIDGNLILDCEVSQQLLSKYPNPVTSQDREFGYMRYQAATCDPKDFSNLKFTLRQLCYFQPRETEIMIVVTMYNEDDVLLLRTLQGVFKNIKYLCSKSRSKTWGKDAWKKIVVCIVSDGRTKINPRSQLLLAALGVYQEGFAKNMVNDKEVVGHIYEYTTMVGISKVKDGQVKLTTQKTVPVQLLFCLKEKNLKKINSHRWCFQAFAPILNPNVVILLDAGTQPSGDSIYHLWKLFDKDPSVAGACGEIKAMLDPKFHKMLYEMVRRPIVYAQNFEYKISNILDKPMESVFGFVSVLPGAFSAYRYVALQNDVNGVGPLLSYFKGETLHNSDAGLFTANMYLAEDRILCFELVAKRGCNWVLKYVKLASAKTDVPEQLPEFILQRRRWLNGSFFALIYSLVHFFNIWGSSHSMMRKFFFHVQFVYQLLNLLVSWFSLGSYFLVFRILTVGLSDPALQMERVGNILSVLFLWLYLLSIVTTFVLSFGNKPQGTKRFYIVIVWFFAILMAYMIFASIYMSVYAVRQIISDNGGTFSFLELIKTERFRDLIVATVSTYLLYLIGSLLFFDPWHMFTSFIQYILLSPAYINVLNIYAFCNIHDISWGTKGDTGTKMDLGVAKQSSTEGKFYIEIPTTNEEVDEGYTRQINILLQPNETSESKPDPEEKEKDYYAFIRSMTVLFWMVSNFALIAIVLETGGINQLTGSSTTTTDDSGVASENSQIFLTVILWLVAFMAIFRFIGGVIYTLLRLVGK